MRSGPKFDSNSVAALGADRLAGILLELAESDAGIKRWLKLELASAAGTDEVSTQIRKRLTSIGKSRGYVDWSKIRSFAEDLEAQRRAIASHVAPKDPVQACDLLWQFLGLATSVYARCDDSNGVIGGIFKRALDDLAQAAQAAKPAPDALAEKVFAGVTYNDYGQFDHLIALMAKPLGQEGLTLLKARFEAMALDPPTRPDKDERRVIGWSSRGAIDEDEFVHRRHARLVQSALTDIADALGDVDGYMQRFSEEEQSNPANAARIAERLLGAGRTSEALWALAKAAGARRAGGYWPDWDRVRIEVLDVSGRAEEAQQARWVLFETLLHAGYLKAYLKKLPDFDNDTAEARALAHAASFQSFHQGLAFLIDWPAPGSAAGMILSRFAELDGDHFGLLTAAAELLEAKHPLAATLALRAMIEFALDKARAKRYPHAARHLATCHDLAARIADFGPHLNHEAYVAALQARHGRKSGFWNA